MRILLLLGAAIVAGLMAGGCPQADDGNLTITARDHVLGSASAAITVIEYGDFECPVCGRFAAETFPTIRRDFIDTGKVRWVFRHFPLQSVHPHARAAAAAAQCAGEQGQFWEYHDLLFANQDALESADLRGYAGDLSLDLTTFDACTAGSGAAGAVDEDISTGAALGVSGTPTFFIQGTKVVGFRDAETFAALLDAALANGNAAP